MHGPAGDASLGLAEAIARAETAEAEVDRLRALVKDEAADHEILRDELDVIADLLGVDDQADFDAITNAAKRLESERAQLQERVTRLTTDLGLMTAARDTLRDAETTAQERVRELEEARDELRLEITRQEGAMLLLDHIDPGYFDKVTVAYAHQRHQEHLAAVASLEDRLREVTEPRPMSTAPRNGGDVLLLREDGEFRMAWWGPDDAAEFEGWLLYQAAHSDQPDWPLSDDTFTGWLPLPPLPEKVSGE